MKKQPGNHQKNNWRSESLYGFLLFMRFIKQKNGSYTWCLQIVGSLMSKIEQMKNWNTSAYIYLLIVAIYPHLSFMARLCSVALPKRKVQSHTLDITQPLLLLLLLSLLWSLHSCRSNPFVQTFETLAVSTLSVSTQQFHQKIKNMYKHAGYVCQNNIKSIGPSTPNK